MFSVVIGTENAAFEDARDEEVARILAETADKLDRGVRSPDEGFPLFDINGNKVGEAIPDSLANATGLKPYRDGQHVTLEIATDNAAFGGDQKAHEVARLLRSAGELLLAGRNVILRDSNGNRVGGLEEHVRHAPSTDGTVYVRLSDIGDPDSYDWRLVTDDGEIEAIAQRLGLPYYGAAWTGVMTSLGDGVADQDAKVFVAESTHPWERFAEYLQVVEDEQVLAPALEREREARLAARKAAEADLSKLFGYYIDVDERGSFLADVRNAEGKTVFEIKAGSELAEGESSIFDDGFMKNKADVAGLTEYLQSLSVIPNDARVLPRAEYEQELDEIKGRIADLTDDTSPEPT